MIVTSNNFFWAIYASDLCACGRDDFNIFLNKTTKLLIERYPWVLHYLNKYSSKNNTEIEKLYIREDPEDIKYIYNTTESFFKKQEYFIHNQEENYKLSLWEAKSIYIMTNKNKKHYLEIKQHLLDTHNQFQSNKKNIKIFYKEFKNKFSILKKENNKETFLSLIQTLQSIYKRKSNSNQNTYH